MSKIITLSKHALRNATHLQVMRNCVNYADALSGINDPRLATVKATFLTRLDQEDDLFQISQGSKYTKQIEDADKRRDRAYSIIASVSAAFADGFGPDNLTVPAQQDPFVDRDMRHLYYLANCFRGKSFRFKKNGLASHTIAMTRSFFEPEVKFDTLVFA